MTSKKDKNLDLISSLQKKQALNTGKVKYIKLIIIVYTLGKEKKRSK